MKAEKGNEYPRPICLSYPYDLAKIEENFELINSGYFVEDWFHSMPYLLVHPFDLAILKGYIDYKKVQKVTELGCGSTSRFLDRICKVQRETFALEDMLGGGIPFNKCDIYESTEVILDSCKTSDLLIVDALHCEAMAECYLDILKETKIPVFIHDWYLPDEETWPEQNYWLKHILHDAYNEFIIARALETCPKDSFVHGGIPPCSAILEYRV